MKNKTYVKDGVGHIEIVSMGVTYIATVDLDDLKKVEELGASWGILCDVRSDTNYARARVNGKHTLLHRWLLGLSDGVQTDHKDRNGLNNKRENIRACTQPENRQNIGAYKCNRTGVRGVTFHKATRKYQVNVQVNGVNRYLGIFKTIEEADIVARKARAELMPYVNG